MQKAFDTLKNRFHIGFILFLFLLAMVVVAYMLPKEQKFKYEYHKGNVWKYENLTAPFPFPIYKTEFELSIERDSVLKDFKPYFNFDAYTYAEKLNQFKDEFDTKWLEYSIQNYKIPNADKYFEGNRYVALRDLQQYYHNLIHGYLESVYLKGIVQLPDEEDVDLSGVSTFVLVRGNIAEENDFSSLFTSKEAYQQIRNKINEELSSDKRRNAARYYKFFNTLEVERYLKANVFYNPDASNREKSNRLSQISLTKGRIQHGELIISKGEIITQDKFQVLESLKQDYKNQQGNAGQFLVRLGRGIVIAIAFISIFLFLYNFRREVLNDFTKTIFILFMILLMLFMASSLARNGGIKYYYALPFTILPIILRTFYDERLALFVHIPTILIAGFLAPNSFEFVFLNIFASVAAILGLTNLYRRSKFFLSALLVVVTYSITYFGISMLQEGSFTQIEFTNYALFGINGVLTLVSFLLIYLFEKTFRFLSDTTLMELSDTNQPLLRKLAEVAPGTFQHSMQVASLAEDAIYHIGGNPLLVRTGALYHDIGKMKDPIYFIENQARGINPHDNMEFEQSASVIIGHVNHGVEIARKHKLPEAIIDFIRTHHGTSTVQYFYKSYIRKYPDADVDLQKFQYPGPKPSSREMAVLMIADSVEAASRSLKEYSEESIGNLVESIVGFQMSEHQFDEADITYKDITEVKRVLKVRLKNIYHARISYPK